MLCMTDMLFTMFTHLAGEEVYTIDLLVPEGNAKVPTRNAEVPTTHEPFVPERNAEVPVTHELLAPEMNTEAPVTHGKSICKFI